jgi:hypothetical protein
MPPDGHHGSIAIQEGVTSCEQFAFGWRGKRAAMEERVVPAS